MKKQSIAGKIVRVIIILVLVGIVLLTAAGVLQILLQYHDMEMTFADIKALDEIQQEMSGISDYQCLTIGGGVGIGALLILVLDIVSICASNKKTARIAGRA